MQRWESLRKWFVLGIGVKRWLLLLGIGVIAATTGLAYLMHEAGVRFPVWINPVVLLLIGGAIALVAFRQLIGIVLAPFRRDGQGKVVDIVYAHRQRERGPRVVAIGGGTGLPSVLRGLKAHTGNITAVVTVADNGGSSGRLRRDLGILPPGDLRNNIAALADDENLMTQLFQYRFDSGDLGGHSFGNLFITALAGVTGSIETGLAETGRVLNIQGRVLPASLDNVDLVATVHLQGMTQTMRILGESQIGDPGAKIVSVELSPPDVVAYHESVRAILEADLVILGPGSLYTSILPNLLVPGILDAIQASPAHKVYVCNVATQPGETEDYDVADHVLALERHIGPGVFQTILANSAYPSLNAGENTHYVQNVPPGHEILQRYELRAADLTDSDRPWRHDPQKLAAALLDILKLTQISGSTVNNVFTTADKPAIM